MLITNDYELEVIMKMTGLKKAEILSLTGMIITTLGEAWLPDHCQWKGPERCLWPKASEVLGPTGAGDAYRAGLLKGLASDRDLETSAKMGAVAATYAIEKYGTQEHHYTYEDYAERYRMNFGKL